MRKGVGIAFWTCLIAQEPHCSMLPSEIMRCEHEVREDLGEEATPPRSLVYPKGSF